jgi:hypothetical protein
MEVSRITRGKIELRREPVEIAAVVRSAGRDQPAVDRGRSPYARSRNSSEPLTLDGDAVRLTQVSPICSTTRRNTTDDGGQHLAHRLEGRRARSVISVRDTEPAFRVTCCRRCSSCSPGRLARPGPQGGLGHRV